MTIRNGLGGAVYDDVEPRFCTTDHNWVWDRVQQIAYDDYDELVSYAVSVGHSMTTDELNVPSAAWIAANRVQGLTFGVHVP